MNEQYPLGVSVLVRSMNRACLRDALEALDAQTYRHVQILVIDATGGELQALPVEVSLPCRIIPSATPLPRAEAANAGLDSVTTPYALFLDEDDLVDPNHLERLLAALATNEAPAAYAGVRLEQAGNNTETSTENSTDDVMDSPWLEGELLVRNTLPIHAVLFRMAAVKQANARFDTQLTLLEDWDFWLQLATQGAFIHAPGVSATYRLSLGESGLSAERSAERYEHARDTVYRKWLPSADLNVLSQCIGKLNDLSEQQRWDISQLRQDVAALHSESRTVYAEYKQDVEQYQEDAAALNSQIKSLEAYNLTLEEHNRTLEEQRSALEANYSSLEANYSTLENRYNTLESHFTALERSFQALLNSRSMRLTAPLRWLMSRLRQPTPDAALTPAAPAAPPPAKGRQKAPVGPIAIIVPV
ncbi:glycosyltransferase family 2 protein [Vreelandella lionensis]|uniref:glycosyltransferase family 2 protein n=1 Tax=Vreelandella lionensis TaxID=1144478 RepID=UPI0013747DC7|nr:glycosyltransferase family A protein [Halomonas lionensis]